MSDVESTFVKAINETLARAMRADERVIVLGEDVAEGGPYLATAGPRRGVRHEPGAQHADQRGRRLRRGDRRRPGGAAAGRRDHVHRLHHARARPARQPGGEGPLHVGRPAVGAARAAHPGRSRPAQRRAALAEPRGVADARPRAEGRDAELRRRRRRAAARARSRIPNPVVFVENKSLYFRRETVPRRRPSPIPIGRAPHVLRPAHDITIVATSRMLGDALEAAERLAAERRRGGGDRSAHARAARPRHDRRVGAAHRPRGHRPRGGDDRRLRRRARRAAPGRTRSTASRRRSSGSARRSRRCRSARRSRTPTARARRRSTPRRGSRSSGTSPCSVRQSAHAAPPRRCDPQISPQSDREPYMLCAECASVRIAHTQDADRRARSTGTRALCGATARAAVRGRRRVRRLGDSRGSAISDAPGSRSSTSRWRSTISRLVSAIRACSRASASARALSRCSIASISAGVVAVGDDQDLARLRQLGLGQHERGARTGERQRHDSLERALEHRAVRHLQHPGVKALVEVDVVLERFVVGPMDERPDRRR